MKRRVAIAHGAGAMAALALPCLAPAQAPAKLPRIGVLRWGTPGDEARDGLTKALADIGYRDGQTIRIEWRWATSVDLAQRHAAELGAMGLDLIVASATPAAQALRVAKVGAPVVLGSAADPVGAGLVASLARPGGNMTGVSSNLTAMVPKQLQMLREALPGLQRVAFLGSTQDVATRIFREQAQAAANQLNLQLQVHLIAQSGEFPGAAQAMARERAQAVLVQPLFALGQSAPLAEAMLQHKLPAISAYRQFVLAGGFMGYGPNRAEAWRRAASYVDRILRGAVPGDLPIEEPTTFELTISTKTARLLGLRVPQALLLRADEVVG